MDFTYSQIDMNSYVAKYMDEMGCSLDQACTDLGIEQSQVFSQEEQSNIY